MGQICEYPKKKCIFQFHGKAVVICYADKEERKKCLEKKKNENYPEYSSGTFL